MSISCRSYFMIGNLFVPAEQFSGPVLDGEYIAGAIELTIDDVCILDRSMWDMVGILWAYIVNGLEELSHGRPFVTTFPDQSIELAFQPLGRDRVQITVTAEEPLSVVMDREFFLERMTGEADAFFELLMRLPGLDLSYRSVLEKIDGLKARKAGRRRNV